MKREVNSRRFHRWSGLLFGMLWVCLGPRFAYATVDNTTCTVLSASDRTDDFNSLRRKVEKGYNNTDPNTIRACTERIQFGFGRDFSIALQSSLVLHNDSDQDCAAGPGKPPVCGDGWGLILDGTTSIGVTLDAIGLPEGSCALRIQANRVLARGIKIKVRRRADAICDEGEHNDTTGVEIEADDDRYPTPLPTPRPTPGPTPRPTPEPTPLPSPTPQISPTPTPAPTATPQPTATPRPTPTAGPTPTATPSNDKDHDGILNGVDDCPTIPNPDQTDSDHDSIGDACDDDFSISPNDDDGDGVTNDADNCPNVANPTQADADHDDIGDACDTDMSVHVPDRFPGFKEPGTTCALGFSSRPYDPLLWILLSFLPTLGLRARSGFPGPRSKFGEFAE